MLGDPSFHEKRCFVPLRVFLKNALFLGKAALEPFTLPPFNETLVSMLSHLDSTSLKLFRAVHSLKLFENSWNMENPSRILQHWS